ncbi:MAG: hypothetical protein QXF46_09525 [Thermofilaceae archaeon]
MGVVKFYCFSISVEDAKCKILEGKFGLIPHYKFRLGKVIRRLALTGEAIDVQEAKEIGLVDKAKGGEGKRGNG